MRRPDRRESARRRLELTLLLFFLMPIACARRPSSAAAGTPPSSADSLVALVGPAGRSFPTIEWSAIPRLLVLGAEKRPITNFPRNPDSSQFEESCSGGMVALWLIEGLRQGGRFPSLNALCFSKSPVEGNWGEASEANHEAVLAAYRRWWKEQGERPREEAAAVDPLAGTGLHWY